MTRAERSRGDDRRTPPLRGANYPRPGQRAHLVGMAAAAHRRAHQEAVAFLDDAHDIMRLRIFIVAGGARLGWSGSQRLIGLKEEATALWREPTVKLQ
jgi:hypothetical protein